MSLRRFPFRFQLGLLRDALLLRGCVRHSDPSGSAQPVGRRRTRRPQERQDRHLGHIRRLLGQLRRDLRHGGLRRHRTRLLRARSIIQSTATSHNTQCNRNPRRNSISKTKTKKEAAQQETHTRNTPTCRNSIVTTHYTQAASIPRDARMVSEGP